MTAYVSVPAVGGRRVAVIGDVGGHRRELERELARLGADRGRLPADLVVIQVGDLVHRGPDSTGVVALVDSYLRTQPEQWIQLVGNHEAQYLRDPAFVWPERLEPETVDTLRRWWRSGLLLAGAAVGGAEDVLVTHAGLTAGYWRDVLGAPPDAGSTARALNAQVAARDERLFLPGQMLLGGEPNPGAGPLWAQAATELVAGWSGGPVPFSQIHGHSTLAGRHHRVPEAIRSRTTVHRMAGHEVTELDGGRIVGVDPGHGRTAHLTWRAWEVAG